MATPIAKRSQTTVMGETSRKATLVAIKDAPQTVTANRASRMGISLDLGIGFLWRRMGQL
jgi:hypothetical protein